MIILNHEPENYNGVAQKILEDIGEVDNKDKGKDYDVIITRLKPVDIDKHPNLKAIVTPATGLTHIDLKKACERGIEVLSLNGETEFLTDIHATAEHTWGLLLSLIRKIPQAYEHVLTGGWERGLFKGTELHGKKLLVLGYGRIGRMVAGYGQAFGMRVIYCDKNEDVPYSKADIITVHVSYDQVNLISDREFDKMKYGTLLINTSRGQVVDEDALLNALKWGKVAGAALDVVSSNKLIDYARDNDNVLITPHIGGCTYESTEKTEIFMAKKLGGWYEHIRNNPGTGQGIS